MRSPRGVAAAIITAIAATAVIAICQPAAARSIAPAGVRLGVHQFGKLRPADAIVARAGRAGVGFIPGHEGASIGPWSFDIANDGSVWVLDQVNDRLLVWSPGRPGRPARAVPLPVWATDFALGPDGTVYVTSGGEGPEFLYALSPTGQPRWKAALPSGEMIGPLLIGPDAAVYYHHHHTTTRVWTPLTGADGRPLPVAEQRRRTSPHAPMPGGYRLAVVAPSGTERRLVLLGKAGEAVRAWHVTSETALGAMVGAPTLVGGDLVVAFEVAVQRSEFLYEYLVLRLGPAGEIRRRFALDAGAMWGDKQTDLRVGPDGRLYQLRTSPATGVRVARYSLDPSPPTPPSTRPHPTPDPTTQHGPNPHGTDPHVTDPHVSDPHVTDPPVSDPPVSDPPTTLPDLLAAGDTAPAAQVAPRPAGPLLILGLSALTSIVLAALGIWLLRRRRGGPGPAR